MQSVQVRTTCHDCNGTGKNGLDYFEAAAKQRSAPIPNMSGPRSVESYMVCRSGLLIPPLKLLNNRSALLQPDHVHPAGFIESGHRHAPIRPVRLKQGEWIERNQQVCRWCLADHGAQD